MPVPSGSVPDETKEPFTAVGDPLQPFELMPFWRLLANAAEDFPDRTAIIYRDFALTYRELNSIVERAAAGLQQLGIRPGDRVGVCMPNHPAAVVMLYATMRAGATVVMMSPVYAVPALAGQARDGGLTAIATLDDASLLEKITAVASATGVRTIIVAPATSSPFDEVDYGGPHTQGVRFATLSQLAAADRKPAAVNCEPSRDIAALQYSGGTTGAPKGVMLTHANLHTAVRQFQQMLPMLEYGHEVILGIAPFFHIAGMNSVLGPAMAWAATLLIVERFDPVETALVCLKHRVSYISAVPTLYFALNDTTEKMSLMWPDLKCALSGGAPLPEAVKSRFETLIGKPLLHAYGLTECSPPVSVPPPGLVISAACCGQVVPGAELQIRSVSDLLQVLPAGEIGELCVRGPQVMAGYWRRPEDTQHAFVDGFVRTGDLGYLTKDRLLYLVDRLKDIIICSGFNVYPVRVEEALFQHPAISEAMVLGVPDPYRGETVKAFVTLRSGQKLTLEELQAFLQPLLSPIEIPKRLEIREHLPRSAAGKLSRLRLREEIAAEGGASK